MTELKMNFKKIIILLLILAAAVSLVAVAGFYYADRAAGDGSLKTDFVVKSGWGSHRVTAELYKMRMIRSRTMFRTMMKIRGKSGSLKKGMYKLNDGMTVNEIIDKLVSGRTKTVSVTIPEGYNNRQIGDLLTRKGFFKSREEFLAHALSDNIIRKYKIAGKSVEGYLFPDTYNLPVGYEKERIIEHMIDQFFDKVSGLKGFPKDPESVHKLVIMASIVEREAKMKEERPLIAGVFAKRLKMRYPLESCATIQYLFKKPKKRIFYSHLKIESPYNTYINSGLPPGPISSPGLAALSAALNPEETDYLFFVIKGDGSHYFSRSFGEHNRAKRKYIGGSE